MTVLEAPAATVVPALTWLTALSAVAVADTRERPAKWLLRNVRLEYGRASINFIWVIPHFVFNVIYFQPFFLFYGNKLIS
jgi:hypothetical protein